MTWRKMTALMTALMLLGLGAMFFVFSRQELPGRRLELLGVRSLFPAGEPVPVAGAENGWQGYAFPGRFRFLRRSSADAATDHLALARKHAAGAWRRADLHLYAGGLLTLRRANKGYRVLCLFHRQGVNYWADLASASSLDFGLRAVERFLLNLEIGGEKPAPALAGQLAALRGGIPFLAMQTLPQMMGLMAVLFLLVAGITYLANRFGGSCPRRLRAAAGSGGLDACTPHATLRSGGFGRRKISACCLCLEGDWLVIYRFRRPVMRIDLRSERDEIAWEKTAFRYKNIRVLLRYEDFERWRLRLLG